MDATGQKTEYLQHQLDAIQLKEKEQPEELLQKLEHAVEEGANVKSSLHTRTEECHRLFDMVMDWVGLLDQHSKPVEELHTGLNRCMQKLRPLLTL
jgi:uncharacterized NAD-dependent epimerase/dehydratase family protein